MEEPIVAEVTRGSLVESRHCAFAAVVDADGETVFAYGDQERRVFPRSAVKAIQALPLIESGIADRYGLTEAEIALACASHSGEPEHAATARAMLAKAGQAPSCLECGTHWPLSDKAARELAASGATPSALHNNCSGKHAGFVCLSCGLDEDPAGYVRPEHRVQETIRGALEDLTGASHTPEVRGTDGCSIPTYAIPLPALAFGFAKFGTGTGISRGCAAAAKRIRTAVAKHPFMVAGTGRFDTRIMEVLRERAFTKTGAEGVYCAALPELGYGVALKVDDGGTRASQAVMASLILKLLPLEGEQRAAVEAMASPVNENWNGIEVGRIRVSGLR